MRHWVDEHFGSIAPGASFDKALAAELYGYGRVHEGAYSDAIPANTSTTEVITAPGSRSSQVDTIGDQDWFRISLTAGTTYSFALTGSSLSNPYLALYNPSGTLIAVDDDSGPGFNSWIVSYTPSTSGTYFLGARGVGSSTGSYTLEAFVSSTADSIPGDVSTGWTLTINGSNASSQIDSAGDQDWFAVTLTAGQSYAFSLNGGTLSDPTLRLYNAGGTLVAFDDDGGAGLNSLMRYTALTSGIYYLSAGGYDTSTGSYTISAATGPAQNPLDTLDLGFTFSSTDVSIYFATTGQTYSPLGTALRDWTASEQSAVFAALQTIADVTNLTFSLAASAAAADFIFALTDLDPGVLGQTYPGSSNGYLEFAPDGAGWSTSGLLSGGLGFSVLIHEIGHALGLAHPHYDGQDNQIMQGVLSEFDSYGDFLMNQQVFTIMSYNDGWPLGPGGQSPSVNYGYASTPMALDIAALQARYGADPNRNAGDTTYTLGDTNSPYTGYQAIWDTGGTDTIEYTGSRSVNIDLNAATLISQIGGGGVVSYASGVYGGFTIANGVLIENATGGSGGDTLTGNAGANTLNGNAGQDSLYGNDGDDILIGGAGPDTLVGGPGNDMASYITSFSPVVANLGSPGSNVGDAAGDTYNSIEFLWGSSFNDTLTGDGNVNALFGHDGTDGLDGGGGADYLVGGTGNDTYYVDNVGDNVIENSGEGYDIAYASTSAGTALNVEELRLTGTAQYGVGNSQNNIIYGNAVGNELQGLDGNDTLYGAAGIDLLYGNNNDDTLYGEADPDALIGAAGDDLLDGGADHDYMAGGTGDDTYYVDNAGDYPVEQSGEGADTIYASVSYAMTLDTEVMYLTNSAPYGVGNAQNNTICGNGAFNELQGLGGDDILWGGGGVQFDLLYGNDDNDTLYGEGGDDALIGGNGNDIMDGGTGVDYLLGGTGDETYYVDDIGDYPIESPSEGYDIINASTSYTITANVERMNLVGSALHGNGNDEDNAIYGNAQNNELRGFGGADLLSGGQGSDLLYGGGGGDTFLYSATAESSLSTSFDAIMDFEVGVDHIDLSALNGGGGDTFSITHDATSSYVHVDLDGNGEDMFIVVYGVTGLTNSDIIWGT